MKFASFTAPTGVGTTKVDSEKGHLQVSLDGSVMSLTHYAFDGDVTSSIDIDLSLMKTRTKYIVFYSPLKGLIVVDNNVLFKSKDEWAYRMNVEAMRDIVANIYIHNDVSDSLFFSNIPPVSDLTFETVPAKSIYVHDWMEAQYPEGTFAEAHNARVRMATFSDVYTVDSIVALEQQVDMLTSIVQAMLSGGSTEWQDDFFAKVQPHNTLGVRPASEVLTDLEAHKAKVRERQATYLGERL